MEAGIGVNEALLRFEEDFKDDLEAIEAALEMECKAYDLYKRIGYLVADTEMRRLFQRLAMAERDHIQQLSSELKHFL
jgi:rubrerythrin